MIVKLKGTSFYQSEIEEARSLIYQVGVLDPEPENEHDQYAIVFLVNNKKVGYLPRNWQKKYNFFP